MPAVTVPRWVSMATAAGAISGKPGRAVTPAILW
jgi:hypothetical protein